MKVQELTVFLGISAAAVSISGLTRHVEHRMWQDGYSSFFLFVLTLFE